MHLQNPDYIAKAHDLCARAAFVQDLGITLTEVEPGHCVTTLAVQPRHLQQDGFVHAGVLATLADHTAGAAAVTLVRPDQTILSVEYKINLLRPALGEALRCVAHVLRQGRTLVVAEADVFSVRDGDARLVAKAMVTLAVVRFGATGGPKPVDEPPPKDHAAATDVGD